MSVALMQVRYQINGYESSTSLYENNTLDLHLFFVIYCVIEFKVISPY